MVIIRDGNSKHKWMDRKRYEGTEICRENLLVVINEREKEKRKTKDIHNRYFISETNTNYTCITSVFLVFLLKCVTLTITVIFNQTEWTRNKRERKYTEGRKMKQGGDINSETEKKDK